MPTYVFRGTIEPDQRARRDEIRPVHLAYHETQDNRAGGPLTDEHGSATGSLIIFDAPDRDAAIDRVLADPYVSEGVVSDWTLDVFVRAHWPAGSS